MFYSFMFIFNDVKYNNIWVGDNMEKYKYLLGKKIEQIVEEEDYFNFLTEDEIISIPKFEGYCACYVGEYIDEINVEGKCNGIITNIETNINDSYLQDSLEVYKGLVSFYFENVFACYFSFLLFLLDFSLLLILYQFD